MGWLDRRITTLTECRRKVAASAVVFFPDSCEPTLTQWLPSRDLPIPRRDTMPVDFSQGKNFSKYIEKIKLSTQVVNVP
ncbi:hypothetical protein EVAR_47997_1 [Eumeta japonica]|uniref:Uncharacterized protein n=1 Tax=Eumeta variegata TaxID=151549 RepID=A0A4C1XJQ6_EUMVA|nr:hypothetical protein EVAR_47997_1 [Eumeta japonica]